MQNFRPFTWLMTAIFSLTVLHAEPPTAQKLIVLGDSITKHGPAIANLGWSGNWGMAASSEDKDYVHLFYAKLTEFQKGQAPELIIFAEGGGTITGKASVKEKIRAIGADLAVVQLGENDREVTEAGFQKPYEDILEQLKAGNPAVRIYCFSVWAGNPAKDNFIRNACKKYGATFVYLGESAREPANYAKAEERFTHPGVNWHPGDKGMQAYADILWQAYTNPEAAAAAEAKLPAAPAVAATTGKGAASVVLAEKWDGSSGLKWTPEVKTESVDGKTVVRIENPKVEASVFFRVAVPLDKMKSRTVTLKTRIKGENITDKPKPWNGVKLMYQFQNAEAKMDYPQAPAPVGTFDWVPVTWTIPVPDNIVTGYFTIGLEQVQGTLWIDTIEISAQ